LGQNPSLTLGLFAAGLSPSAQAHFQELIPSTEMIDSASGPSLRLDLRFTHPMARGP
jgi:cobalt/nickel transport protein